MVVLKNQRKLMPLVSLSRFETLLSEAGASFLQVHRSYLVARKHITSVTPNNIIIHEFQIPIGVQYREKFFKAIGMKDDEQVEENRI